MKKLLLIMSLLIALTGCAYAERFTAGDVIVVLKPGESKVSALSVKTSGAHAARLESFASGLEARVTKTYVNLSTQSNSLFAVLHSDTKNPEEFAAELLKNPEVIAACPNYRVKAARTPNDPRYGDCWGLDFMDAPSAWNTTTGSEEVYVAVIDTGIDWTNPDLTDNVDRDLSKNVIAKSNSNALDDQGHGSHVAGIIGARGDNGIGIAGINWQVKLIAVKALASDGYGELTDVISGIEYITGLVNQGYKIASINMSLEWYESIAPEHDNLVRHPMWRALKALDQTNKTVIVSAAGNYGQTIGRATTDYEYGVYEPGQYVYPASYVGLNNLISVSAHNDTGTLASWSNKGANIAAPGVDILSTYLQDSSNTPTLYTEDGTSMAAPHVAGAAALIAAAYPNLTAYQIKTAILQGSSEKDARLNLAGAMQYPSEHFNMQSTGSEGTAYNDYTNYDADYYDNYDNGYNYDYPYSVGSSSSGGCNSFAVSLCAFAVIMPLIRRKK